MMIWKMWIIPGHTVEKMGIYFFRFIKSRAAKAFVFSPARENAFVETVESLPKARMFFCRPQRIAFFHIRQG